jgi:hypothetical protein
MPVTTFLHHKPSHPDEEINDCLNELNSYYNEPRWFADFKVHHTGRFLSSRVTGSQLYYHLGDGEYQVINGADCDKSIKAYLYGCLNFI